MEIKHKPVISDRTLAVAVFLICVVGVAFTVWLGQTYGW